MAPRKRATKTRAKSRARPKRKVLRRKNLPVLTLAGLFCVGILVGAYLIDNAYQMRQEHIALQEAERRAASEALAAEHARIEAQRRAAIVAKSKHQTIKPVKPNTVFETELATQAQAQDAKPPTKAKTKVTKAQAYHSQYTPDSSSTIVAIVIDDIGYKRFEGERTLALPGKLTVAVLPFTPYAQSLALQAPKHGKEVMLHAPMEPKRLSRWGEGLTSQMNEHELRASLVAMIDDIPNLAGVNNHMGSGLTENLEAMQWLMEELPPRGLYFIDSRTTAASQALASAKKRGIPTYERDIFLDHSRDTKTIARQFDKLIATAQKHGQALGIGHPYPETLEVLESRLPALKKAGVELVTVSELLNAVKARRTLAHSGNAERPLL